MAEKPVYKIDGPVICDGCGKPFRSGKVDLEDGTIIRSSCLECYGKWLSEFHPELAAEPK